MMIDHENVRRKSSLPNLTKIEDYSKLIEPTDNDEAMRASKRRGHKSSLSMVDAIHAQKVSTGHIGDLKPEFDADNYKFGENGEADFIKAMFRK